jgi:hypothetical protein
MKRRFDNNGVFKFSLLKNNFLNDFFLLGNKNLKNNNTYIDVLSDKNFNRGYAINFDSESALPGQVKATQPALYLYKPDNSLKNTNSLTCFFLRKSKNFNKGRYSRNRQVYRTGVYMCFYINVAALYGLWFYFYKFKFKFSYFWWLFILLPFSFINARALKYNLYLPKEFLLYLYGYVN